MTASPNVVANPRRTTLSTLSKGSTLAGCSAPTCRNVAVRVVSDERGPRPVCRTCG